MDGVYADDIEVHHTSYLESSILYQREVYRFLQKINDVLFMNDSFILNESLIWLLCNSFIICWFIINIGNRCAAYFYLILLLSLEFIYSFFFLEPLVLILFGGSLIYIYI